MKQILQNIANGETLLAEVPVPQNRNGNLLISTRKTLVSSGSERMLMNFGKAGYIEKARQQPDKVKDVIRKIKTDGIIPTIEAIQSKLDKPIPLGYCNSGVVIKSNVTGFNVGDRVVSNGPHAEIVRVPKNLCAKIPDNVDDDAAAFTVMASIGLQGIRLANPTLGENVIVSGLGVIGLLTLQMLIANGCRVLGIDVDSSRCKLAQSFGAETIDLSKGIDPVPDALKFSKGNGVDAVIITASTNSNNLIHQAAQMSRKRGRIVLVGVTGLELNRDDFYEKEISFQVSSSYGPGRYDPFYEDQGNDYPLGFVRWTEQRNFEAVLEMISNGSINVKPLISHNFLISNALEAYKLLNDQSSLGILIDYKSETEDQKLTDRIMIDKSTEYNHRSSDAVVAFIGSGNYASRTLIPAFKKSGAKLKILLSDKGLSAYQNAQKSNFSEISTNIESIADDDLVNTVVIATRHNLHAEQVIMALESNKNIFVEKPIALSIDEIENIDQAYKKASQASDNSPRLMVGFNRRFSPHIKKMKSLVDYEKEPKSIIMTINAGYIPHDHWTQDPEVGGGRIVGEACHFIDLMRFIIGHPIIAYDVIPAKPSPGSNINFDEASINITFSDGSIGTIHYLSSGAKSFPKERIEIFCNGSILQLNNFKLLKGYDWPGFKKYRTFAQNKGQKECVDAFVSSILKGEPSPISYEEVIEVSRASVEIADMIKIK